MTQEPRELTIYTIGHSNVPIAKLLGLLQEHGIQLVMDVRSVPYSRFARQFNREALAPALEKLNIGYQYSGDGLGGRPRDPAMYKGGAIPTGKANFLQAVDYEAAARAPGFVDALARLVETARNRRTAILCSEEDPNRCHRHHLIARALVRRGVIVQHIRGNGHLEPVRPDSFDLTLTEKAMQPVLLEVPPL